MAQRVSKDLRIKDAVKDDDNSSVSYGKHQQKVKNSKRKANFSIRKSTDYFLENSIIERQQIVSNENGGR